MTLIDIVCIIFFAIFFFEGYKTGLLIALYNLLAAYIAIIIANIYMIALAELISKTFNFSNIESINILSFITLFLVIYYCLKLIGKVLKPLNLIPLFGILNKVAGSLFGLIKGLLISSFIVIYLPLISEENRLEKFMRQGMFSSIIYSLANPIYSTFTWILPKAEEALENIKKPYNI